MDALRVLFPTGVELVLPSSFDDGRVSRIVGGIFEQTRCDSGDHIRVFGRDGGSNGGSGIVGRGELQWFSGVDGCKSFSSDCQGTEKERGCTSSVVEGALVFDGEGDAGGDERVCDGVSFGLGGSGEGVPKGKNWKRNQRKKVNRRGRVNVDTGPDLGFRSRSVECSEVNVDTGFRKVGQSAGVSEKTPLRLSLEEKWRVENELKVAKAKRELELLKAEDLDAVKKLRERKVQGATERTMVQIEKAHASLVQTGNVPGVQPVQQGFCQTVVDGEIVESVPGLNGELKGCSISPSSSISEREVREMKKECEDLKAELDKLKRQLKRTDLAYDVLRGKEHVAVSVVDGSVPESARWALDQVCGKGDWEAVGDLDFDPDTLYLQMDRSLQPGDYAGY